MSGKRLSSHDILIQTEVIEQRANSMALPGLLVFMRGDDTIGLQAGAFRLFLGCDREYGPTFGSLQTTWVPRGQS